MENKSFKLKDQDDKERIVDTHYFNWLKNRKLKDINSTQTKLEYLEVEGFKSGVDNLSTEELDRLRYIEQFYSRRVIDLL